MFDMITRFSNFQITFRSILFGSPSRYGPQTADEEFTIISGSSSFGRAIAFQAIGGQFEPGLPLSKAGNDSLANYRWSR